MLTLVCGYIILFILTGRLQANVDTREGTSTTYVH